MTAKTESRGTVETTGPESPAATKATMAGIAVLVRNWGLSIVALSLLGVAIVLAFNRTETAPHSDSTPAPSPPAEIDLGKFAVAPINWGGNSPAMIEFRLHVTFADQRDEAARHQLAARQFRVRQHVEELLRRTTIDDFDNAALVGLKRQIQSQINDCLELQAVRDVIITDLRLTK